MQNPSPKRGGLIKLKLIGLSSLAQQWYFLRPHIQVLLDMKQHKQDKFWETKPTPTNYSKVTKQNAKKNQSIYIIIQFEFNNFWF